MTKLNKKTLSAGIISTLLIFSTGVLSAADGDRTRVQTRAQVQVQDEVLNVDALQTRTEIRNQTRDQSADAVAQQTRTQVREQIRDAASEEAKDAVRVQNRGGRS